MSIVNYLVHDVPNVGDRAASPFSYINAQAGIFDIRRRMPVKEHVGRDLLVFGGGGLLDEYWDSRIMEHVKQCTSVVWGAGHNHESLRDSRYPAWVSEANLVMVRDWSCGHVWAPCPSCLLPPLARLAITKPIHEYVVYDHSDHPVQHVVNEPRRVNTCGAGAALRFMASGKRVVTSSYHGVYWATLLGREVLAYPVTSKFMFMKHPPRLLGWNQDFHGKTGPRYPFALEECRDATVSAWHRLKGLLQ